MDDFLNAPDSAGVYEFDEARRSADMLLMKADFNKENTELTLTLTTPDYMSKETAEKLKPFLRRPVVYHGKMEHSQFNKHSLMNAIISGVFASTL